MKKINLKKIILFAVLLTSITTKAEEKVIIFLGEEKGFHITSGNVWIENKDILNAQVIGSQLKITAKKEGQTLVSLNNKTKIVFSLHPKKKFALNYLEEALTKTIGLRLEIKRNEIHIVGKLYRLEDLLSIAQKLKDIPHQYTFSARMSDQIKEKLHEYLKNQIRLEGLNPVAFSFNNHFKVAINSNDPQLNMYEKVLSPFGVEIEKNSTSLETSPIVKVQISIAEVKRNEVQKLGINWPNSYSANVIDSKLFSTEDILVNAVAFEQSGLGKILASPNIICKSGKEAEFFAGGEFPIKLLNFRSQNIVWKKYGIILKVKPLADSSGKMSIAIDTEISTLDDSRSVDDIPAINTNKVSSHFDLTAPRTIALSGLIKNELGESQKGLPYLMRIPIFSKLFSSSDFRENRTELVIFVRPEILREDNQSTSELNHLAGNSL